MEKDDRKTLSSKEYAVAGASTGFITRFLCQPLDVLKIRFQLQVEPISKSSQSSKYKSMFQASHKIVQEEGLGALWKGHVPAQFLSVIYGSVEFTTYEVVNQQFKKFGISDGWSQTPLHFASGSIAGVTAVVVSFPFDMIRTRLIAQGEPKVYRGMIDAAITMYKTEGLVGYSRGLIPGIIQVIPSAGLTFGFNNLYQLIWRTFLQKEKMVDDLKKTSRLGSVFSGFLAGLTAKTIIYPLDLTKKRLQVQYFEAESAYFKRIHYYGFLHCFYKTVKHEGFLGLFKGLYPSLVKAAVTNAIYFSVYNEICNMLYKINR